jgi:cell division septation protein DedD
LGALIIVLTLCIIAFALGVFIGKSQQSAPEEKVVLAPAVAPVTHPVVLKPVAALPPQALAPVGTPTPVATVGSGMAVVPEPTNEQKVEQVLNASAGAVKVADELSVQVAAVVEPSPLGNGINAPAPVVEAKPAAAVAVVQPQKVAPAPKVVSKVKVVSASAASSKTGFVVQVGSFKKQSDSEKVKKKIGAKFPVIINRVDLGNKGVWFRVLVGPVATEAAAAKLQSQLHDGYKLSGFVKKAAQ